MTPKLKPRFPLKLAASEADVFEMVGLSYRTPKERSAWPKRRPEL
jgi:hypothetical protein